jgi:hypothetical protein
MLLRGAKPELRTAMHGRCKMPGTLFKYRMYRDPLLWKKIQHRILVDGISIWQVANATGISRTTIRKMLANPAPKSHPTRCNTARLAPRRQICAERLPKKNRAKDSAFEWMRAVLQGEIGLTTLQNDVDNLRGVKELIRRVYEGRLSERNRSMVVLAKHHRIPQSSNLSLSCN